MAKRHLKSKKVCVRKGSLTEESVPHSDKALGTYGRSGRRFASDDAAEKFVRRHIEGENWGIFPG